MNLIQLIDLRDWHISYTELVEWCEETGADVYAVIHPVGNGPSAQYRFEHEEDFLAFQLKFAREQKPTDAGCY